MAGLIGKKIGMTSMFSEEGKNIPCTIIEAGPCTVTQIKTKETDGYDAVQISFDEQKESRLSKALLGHYKKAKAAPSKKLAEVLINEVTPVGREIQKLLNDKSHLKNILKKGTEKANIIAEENLKNIREKVGLI